MFDFCMIFVVTYIARKKLNNIESQKIESFSLFNPPSRSASADEKTWFNLTAVRQVPRPASGRQNSGCLHCKLNLIPRMLASR